jgi:hypothetical protein
MTKLEMDLSFLETQSWDGYFIPTQEFNTWDMEKMQEYANSKGIDFDWDKEGITILWTWEASREAVIEILELN